MGVQIIIYCVVFEEMEGVSGKYLVDCVVKEFCKGVKDDDVVKKLWDFSVRLVKLDK